MIRFLRWFAEFRALEAQLQEAASARIFSEDRERLWRAKCDAAEERWQAERDRNDYLSKAVMDHQAISSGHLPIFNIVPVPPRSDDEAHMPGAPPRRSARDVQYERNMQARKASVMPVEVDSTK